MERRVREADFEASTVTSQTIVLIGQPTDAKGGPSSFERRSPIYECKLLRRKMGRSSLDKNLKYEA